MTTDSPWSRPNCIRAAMACFVNAVYDLATNKPLPLTDSIPLTSDFWLYPFHYRRAKIIECEDEDEQLHHSVGGGFEWKKEHHIGGAVFEWRKDAPVPRPAAAPEAVVAFRGTNDACDVKADVFLVMMELHTKPRYVVSLRGIEEAIKKYGADKTWITGHSLGAAICLLAGRDLAQGRLYIEAHVFNPPFPSFFAYENPITNAMHRMVVELLAGLLRDKEERLKKTRDAFLALKNWVPHLYVNKKDLICSSYIAYFSNCYHENIILSGIAGLMAPHVAAAGGLRPPHSLRALIASILHKTVSEPFHLIPCAHLHIAESISKAHSIQQWLSQHTDIQSHQVQLV